MIQWGIPELLNVGIGSDLTNSNKPFGIVVDQESKMVDQ